MIRATATWRLCLAFGAFVAACGGGNPEPASSPTEIEVASVAEAPAPSMVRRGTLLRFLPASCPRGRVYADFDALLAHEETRSVLRKIVEALVDKRRESAERAAAWQVVEESGFDFAADVHEGALCIGEKKGKTTLALKLGIDDPLGVIVSAAAAGDTPAPAPEDDQDGVRFLTIKANVLAQPETGVLLFGSADTIAHIRERSGAAGFASAPDHVVYAHITTNKSAITVTAMPTGSGFELRGTMRLSGKAAQTSAKHPRAFGMALKAKLLDAASELQEGPFHTVYKWAEDADVEVHDDTVTATVTIPASDLTALLESSAPRLGVNIDGGNAPNDGDALDELIRVIEETK